MIPTATLQDWKRLLAKAAAPPVIVAAMDQKGTKFQLQTPRPLAKIVGTVFDKANAEFLSACYQAVPQLIAEVERLRALADHNDKLARSHMDLPQSMESHVLDGIRTPKPSPDADAVSVQPGRRRVR